MVISFSNSLMDIGKTISLNHLSKILLSASVLEISMGLQVKLAQEKVASSEQYWDKCHFILENLKSMVVSLTSNRNLSFFLIRSEIISLSARSSIKDNTITQPDCLVW